MKPLLTLILAATLHAAVDCAPPNCTATGVTESPVYQPVNQSVSYGPHMVFSYSGMPEGIYTVTFTFLEPSYERAGARLMDVSINDSPALSGLDIFARAGNRTLMARSVLAVVPPGSNPGASLVIRMDCKTSDLLWDGTTRPRNAVVSSITIKPALLTMETTAGAGWADMQRITAFVQDPVTSEFSPVIEGTPAVGPGQGFPLPPPVHRVLRVERNGKAQPIYYPPGVPEVWCPECRKGDRVRVLWR